MSFPAQNQTFQKGNFSGFTYSGARRVADSAFDARVSANDTYRAPWNTDETLYGPRFAVLDGVGMLGTGQTLDANGNRHSLHNSISFSELQIACHDGFCIQGGRGTYLRCPITVAPGHGVRFMWRFASTLRSPGQGLDYVGFALVRFRTGNHDAVAGQDGSTHTLLCTTLQLPGHRNYPAFGAMQTSGWQAHDLIHTGANALDGYVEWIVSSGHRYQDGGQPDRDKANAFPCCLALDHVVLI